MSDDSRALFSTLLLIDDDAGGGETGAALAVMLAPKARVAPRKTEDNKRFILPPRSAGEFQH